jgi:hypothetical protein
MNGGHSTAWCRSTAIRRRTARCADGDRWSPSLGPDNVVDPRRIYAHIRVLTDPVTGDEFLACRDDDGTCRDLAQRRQAELDRAAHDALGIETPRPALRLVRGGGVEG